MNKRLQIIQQVMQDLTRLTIANGYNHNIPAVNMTRFDLASLGEFPKVSVLGGEETRERIEAGINSTFKIYILTYIQTATDTGSEGLLTTEAEKWIEDYDNFFRTPDSNLVSVSKLSILYTLTNIGDYYISEVNPYFDIADNNRQIVAVQLTVKFI